MPKKILAFDIGAESGRAILGIFNGKKLTLEEIYRFPNEPVKLRNTIYWDILKLFSEVKNVLRICSKKYGTEISSIGFDTWGVDFGLLNKDGILLSNPVHYRDKRTYGMIKKAEEKIPKVEICNITGMEITPITTILQLFSMKTKNNSILESAKTFLMIPDIFNYFLTGEKSCERTNAITTLLFDINKKEWAKEIFRKLDLPFEIMPNVKGPGTIIGKLSDKEIKDLGFEKILVSLPATHDTGSAVAAVPGKGNFAFISSGTWSIVGGGIQNTVLCQFVANATGLPVITGPKEATTTGNIMVQAIALKEVSNADEIRSVVRNSFEMKTYEPKEREIWNEQYQKYLKLLKSLKKY